MSTTDGRAPDELRNLLAAYALDAVDDVERRTLERYVAQDQDAAEELASLRATAALLGSAAASEPPAALRASILGQLDATAQETVTPEQRPGRLESPSARDRSTRDRSPQDSSSRDRSTPDRPDARRSVTARSRLGRRAFQLAVAAAVVGAISVPSVVAVREHDRAVQAQERADLLSDVLADPGAQLLRAELTGGGEAVAVLTDDRALLVAEGLGALDDDHVYQLWAIRDGVALPSTVVPAEPDGTLQSLASGYQPGDGLAVTVEPLGGSQVATTEPLVVLLPG